MGELNACCIHDTDWSMSQYDPFQKIHQPVNQAVLIDMVENQWRAYQAAGVSTTVL